MLSNRIFLVEASEDRWSELMGEFSRLQDAGLVVDWGCTVPVSLADDGIEIDIEAHDDGTH